MSEPASRQPLLDVAGLRVTYGGVVAVSDVDLQITEGTIFGLIGPNGAGKTSMVDALTGYTRQAAGRIVFDGRDIGALRPYRRARLGLARTFQSVELFDDLTVEENLLVASEHVTVGSTLRDLFLPRRPVDRSSVDWAIEVCGLRGRRRPLPRPDLARQAQAGRHRPGAGPPPPAGPARRARGRTRHRREPRARPAAAGAAGRARRHDLPHRPRHGPRPVRLRPAHGPRLRTPDRGRDPGRDPRRPPRDRGLPRRAPCLRPASSARAQCASPATPSPSRTCSPATAGIPVVRELNLQVSPGEVVALLGPNGAGKTTTLETIAGLHRPISGTVELSGHSVGGTPAYALARTGLALVPEGRALFPGLTVREHLRLAGGRNAGAAAAARTSCSRCSPSCASAWAARPACCPAASSRCWRSAGPWSPGRGCCWSTR